MRYIFDKKKIVPKAVSCWQSSETESLKCQLLWPRSAGRDGEVWKTARGLDCACQTVLKRENNTWQTKTKHV